VVTAHDGLLGETLDEVTAVLRIDRRVPFGKPDNFALSTAEQMVADFRQITSMTFLVMAVLSSIGLLVGGIGVMNIMLVSVTERTPEIGLRMAVGARSADLRAQFLAEAVTLCLGGAVIALALGIITATLVTDHMGVSVRPPLWAALLSTGVATVIGLVFGMYPAERAARLDPIVALRSE
jgi:putative ABC transport system permease protein